RFCGSSGSLSLVWPRVRSPPAGYNLIGDSRAAYGSGWAEFFGAQPRVVGPPRGLVLDLHGRLGCGLEHRTVRPTVLDLARWLGEGNRQYWLDCLHAIRYLRRKERAYGGSARQPLAGGSHDY